MSRQTNRYAARVEMKDARSDEKMEARTVARRKLLERQTARENSGFYEGRSVGSAIAPSRSRTTKRKVKKGKEFGRILSTETIGDREISYHATKGWRSHRA